MDKKQREKEVLDKTIALARLRGGESRRNADRVAGSITQGERPDFVIESDKYNQGLSAVLAVEHFRADHFSELNRRGGHQDSLAVIERNRAAKIQQSWSPPSFDSDIPKNVVDAVGESFAKCLEARFKASYGGYMKSFADGFNSHVGKLGIYRANVTERFTPSREIKAALLIELHSDFSDCFVHDGHRCYKPESGKLLLFDDMVDLLRAQRKNVDYVLFGSYEALKDDLVDAAIIRPALLDESLRRNKLPIFRYLGEDRDKPIYGTTRIKPSATIVDDRIDFELERESQGMSMAERLNACLACLPLVIEAHKNRQSFVTTISMQLLFELYGDVLSRRRRISWNDIGIAQSLLGSEEIERRTRQFEENWYPDQKR